MTARWVVSAPIPARTVRVTGDGGAACGAGAAGEADAPCEADAACEATRAEERLAMMTSPSLEFTSSDSGDSTP
ncbi:hypothetical protein [Candidatus Palauibacter sp.]|uniref:hypothetical protein n=1 Tax=Candidatus Palauibacter sp. TaxID=3101350 RepID=UPI003B020E98